MSFIRGLPGFFIGMRAAGASSSDHGSTGAHRSM
jgi:hypothetical protein